MDPEFVRYLTSIVPGEIQWTEGRYDIKHASGDISTLWLKTSDESAPSSLQNFKLIFDEFDGADLFSSAFKIASVNASRILNGVEITPTLAELAGVMEAEPLPYKNCVPFMTEAGIWIYLFDPSSLAIHKWNIEDHEECDSYASIQLIVEEWVEIVLKNRP